MSLLFNSTSMRDNLYHPLGGSVLLKQEAMRGVPQSMDSGILSVEEFPPPRMAFSTTNI
jgi:hypothetical protein